MKYALINGMVGLSLISTRNKIFLHIKVMPYHTYLILMGFLRFESTSHDSLSRYFAE